jgi:hypothetical protein
MAEVFIANTRMNVEEYIPNPTSAIPTEIPAR